MVFTEGCTDALRLHAAKFPCFLYAVGVGSKADTKKVPLDLL